METSLEGLSDGELVRGADSVLSSGSEGYIVEAMRRLKESNTKQQGTTNRLTRWIMVLTAVMAIFSGINVVLIVLVGVDVL